MIKDKNLEWFVRDLFSKMVTMKNGEEKRLKMYPLYRHRPSNDLYFLLNKSNEDSNYEAEIVIINNKKYISLIKASYNYHFSQIDNEKYLLPIEFLDKKNCFDGFGDGGKIQRNVERTNVAPSYCNEQNVG